jgi:hypothetical protein
MCCGKRHQITHHLIKMRTQNTPLLIFSSNPLEDIAKPQGVRVPKVETNGPDRAASTAIKIKTENAE